jgi:hypothetical protein
MDVLVMIMVVDETGDQIANADTTREAFELAMQEVDVEGV